MNDLEGIETPINDKEGIETLIVETEAYLKGKIKELIDLNASSYTLSRVTSALTMLDGCTHEPDYTGRSVGVAGRLVGMAGKG